MPMPIFSLSDIPHTVLCIWFLEVKCLKIVLTSKIRWSEKSSELVPMWFWIKPWRLVRKTVFRGCLSKEWSCNTKKVLYQATCKLRAVHWFFVADWIGVRKTKSLSYSSSWWVWSQRNLWSVFLLFLFCPQMPFGFDKKAFVLVNAMHT